MTGIQSIAAAVTTDITMATTRPTCSATVLSKGTDRAKQTQPPPKGIADEHSQRKNFRCALLSGAFPVRRTPACPGEADAISSGLSGVSSDPVPGSDASPHRARSGYRSDRLLYVRHECGRVLRPSLQGPGEVGYSPARGVPACVS